MPQFLNILLQKNEPNSSWGFEVAASDGHGHPLVITKVHPNSFCSPYLRPRDRIIRVEGVDVELLSEAEARNCVEKPARSLNLLVEKWMGAAARTPSLEPPTVSGGSGDNDRQTALGRADSGPEFRSCWERRREYETRRDSPTTSLRGGRSDGPPRPADPTPSSTPQDGDENDRSLGESRWAADDGRRRADARRPPGRGDRCAREDGVGWPAGGPRPYTVRSVRSDNDDEGSVSRVYLSPFAAKINLNDPKIARNLDAAAAAAGRQASDMAEKWGPPAATVPNDGGLRVIPMTNNIGAARPTAVAPAPAAPPPPPAPASSQFAIPAFQLESEILERGIAGPPAKLQNAMVKEKKPFTYTPGGIDLSEIRSPRIARRVMRNAREPEDVILPSCDSTSSPKPMDGASLPASSIDAACPRIAVPVLPQSHAAADRRRDERFGLGQRPAAPAAAASPPTRAAVAPASSKASFAAVATAGAVRPPNAAFARNGAHQNAARLATTECRADARHAASLSAAREAPTLWPNERRQQQPENTSTGMPTPMPSSAPWACSAFNGRNKLAQHRPTRTGQSFKANAEPESNEMTNDERNILIQNERTAPKINRPKRWVNDDVEDTYKSFRSTATAINKDAEAGNTPIQSHSFKVLQKITNSEDVHEDMYLHNMESHLRYRGSATPSRAFRMVQNMTDSDQDTPKNIVLIPINDTNYKINQNEIKQYHPARNTLEINAASPSQLGITQQEIIAKKNYIPPSERKAEQDLQKYMGSSIPSRSFKVLQAMTATQDSTA